VKCANGVDVGVIAKIDFRRHRIFERGFDRPSFQMRPGDRMRVARPPFLAKVRDDGRRAEDARGLERHKLGIAGADTDAVKRAGFRRAHSASLASALAAAAAIALPPLRPLIIANGTRPSAANASLDSIAPTNPTGIPITA